MTKIPARVISDNRITIPEEFRDAYDEEGDRVLVSIEPWEPVTERDDHLSSV